jgi:hypothetical protein
MSSFVDAILNYKFFSKEGIPVLLILPSQNIATPLLMKTEYYRLEVIVDIACEDSIQFMTEVRSLYHKSWCS